jgi:hypothetical protein
MSAEVQKSNNVPKRKNDFLSVEKRYFTESLMNLELISQTSAEAPQRHNEADSSLRLLFS